MVVMASTLLPQPAGFRVRCRAMSKPQIDIRPHRPSDAGLIGPLLDKAFGADRHKKTAYRLRDGVPPVPGLSFCARVNGVLRGSIQFWPVVVAGQGDPVAALLLGPLAVDPDLAGQGIGLALMEHGLDEATKAGHRLVILVGDEPYYARAGFRKTVTGTGAEGLRLPGPVDPNRLLVRELVPGAAEGLAGHVEQAKLSGNLARTATQAR